MNGWNPRPAEGQGMEFINNHNKATHNKSLCILWRIPQFSLKFAAHITQGGGYSDGPIYAEVELIFS